MSTLYISDLDGTLLTKEGAISSYSEEMLNKLIDRGLNFTFATARSIYSAQKAIRGLRLKFPVVLYHGGLVYDYSSREYLRVCNFGDELKRYVLYVLETHGIYPFVYRSDQDDREIVSWTGGKETDGMSRFLSRRKSDPRFECVSSDEALVRDHVFYFKCIGPKEQLERVWNDLKMDDRLLCIFHKETYQSDYWMEILPKGANKAFGAKFLKEKYGFDKVVCFGDSSNDSDLFDVCDEKYAVLNAEDWLKEKATSVIGYCEEDGVAKWLEKNGEYSR